MSGLSEGAQARTTPVVGWAQATILRPPAGAALRGMITTPDTAIGSLRRPVER